jgi:hypothetical protein
MGAQSRVLLSCMWSYADHAIDPFTSYLMKLANLREFARRAISSTGSA